MAQRIMNRSILCLFFCCTILQPVFAQEKTIPVSLNHIYIVLDSITYNHLFDSSFIEQKLGNIKTSSVTTTDDSWSGKYLFGRNSYFEFFSPGGFESAVEGDFGLGFMTVQSGDITGIEKHWKETTADSVQTDTTIRVKDKKSFPWFYSIYLSADDSALACAAWVMENTTEELRSVGFSDAEIKKEIQWKQYSEKRNKKDFTKLFDHIQYLQLSLTAEEYEYIKRSLKGFGLQEKNNVFFNDDVQIVCNVETNPVVRVRTIEIALTKSLAESIIKISDHLSIEIKEKKAIWKFR